MLPSTKTSEISILVIVSLMSFTANLPSNFLNGWVDQRLLLATLTASIVIALFKHLRVLLSLSIGILAIGANLPAAIAEKLNVSPLVMTLALAAIIVVTLLNRTFSFLPSGLGSSSRANDEATRIQIKTPAERIDTAETRLAILVAIGKGDVFALKRLLSMNIGINFSENGEVPILLATERGYTDILRTLIEHGADLQARNGQGKSAFEIALERKDLGTAELLYSAIKTELPKSERARFVDLFFSSQQDDLKTA